MYDCDFGRHRYREAQQTIYVHQLMEHSVDTYRLRLCPQHFRDIQEATQTWRSTADLVPLTGRCQADCDVETGCRFVAKLYQAKQPMDEREIELCPPHMSRLGNDLRFYNGELLERA